MTDFCTCAAMVMSLSLTAFAVDSGGAAYGGLAVTRTDRAAFLTGTATDAPPSGGQPAVCSALGVRCARFDLRITLPRGVWRRPGGVQVAIRWPSDDNALDLYVYRRGSQVGKAEGFLAAMS